MTVVGELALWVALFLALWGGLASFGGARTGRPDLVASGVRSVIATAWMTTLACLGLWSALLGHDFSLEYVASHSTINTPTLYLITAFWAGPAGATLSVALALSLCSGAGVLPAQRAREEELPWVAGTLAAMLAILLLAVCFVTNPYDRVEWVPAEGRGLDPRLQNPLATAYYLATYGACGTAGVPLALAVSGAARRKAGTDWHASVRPWTFVTWCLLAVSIVVRMRWTYLGPGAGGFWRADAPTTAAATAWVLALMLLIGKRPASAAALVVYVGVLILLTGLAATRWWSEEVISLRPGEVRDLGGPHRWRFVSQGVSRDERTNYLSTGVALEAWRDDRRVGIISAERRQYIDSVQRPVYEPVRIPGVRSSLGLDVYMVVLELRGDAAQVRVGFRPLVACVWIGWLVIAAGGLTLGVRPSPRQARPSASGRVAAV